MNSALTGNSFQVCLSRLKIAILQILFNSVIEENSILRNDDDVFSEGIKGVILDILTINQHLAALRIVNPEEKMQQGSLAETGWSNDSVASTCFYLQIKVLEQVVYLTFILGLFLLRLSTRNLIILCCYALMTKAHIFELYSSAIELELGSIG